LNKTEHVYKTIATHELKIHVFQPQCTENEPKLSAIVFFFGGGWSGGNPKQFFPFCEHFASRGIVAMSAEYRIKSIHGTTPFECVRDGKSALRWIRTHAAEFNIDPERIIAGGGSAGGHVAASLSTVPGLDEPGEDTSVSCRPVALVLFNPVVDNGPDGYGYDQFGERFTEISPMHNLGPDTPPTVIMLGTKDPHFSVEAAENYKSAMEAHGVRCDLCLYDEQPHGFFNYRNGENPYYDKTLTAADQFLVSLGFLPEADLT
jgi:acetyl esterase/lipase